MHEQPSHASLLRAYRIGGRGQPKVSLGITFAGTGFFRVESPAGTYSYGHKPAVIPMPKLKDQSVHGTRWNRQTAEAARLNVSVEKLRQLTRSARIPHLNVGASCLLYNPSLTDQALWAYSETRENGRFGNLHTGGAR